MNERSSPHEEGPPTVPSDWSALRPAPARSIEQTEHRLEFSASGSEYFRIWIVNLLLTLVTAGLYYPWAKVRKLRYFYGNTRLAGHAFDFHGEPKRMLRGYLLVSALFLLYAFAGQVSPAAGLVALAILGAIWPALLAASLRFRLAQTSWRGLRFRFTGETADAYKALLPAFVAALVMVGLGTLVLPDADGAAAQAAAGARGPSGFVLFLYAMSLLAMLASAPWTLWLLKRFQHDNYQFASVRTRFAAGAGSFYRLALKTAGLGVLIGVAGALVGMALAMAVGFAVGLGGGEGRAHAGVLVGLVAVFATYVVVLLVLQPYVVSRLQNLAWSRTESRSIGFASALRFGSLARLTLFNFFLVVVTLGFYWPFAAVATARLRLQAVTVLARGDLDALVARASSSTHDAAGDAAGDVFGIDLGM